MLSFQIAHMGIDNTCNLNKITLNAPMCQSFKIAKFFDFAKIQWFTVMSVILTCLLQEKIRVFILPILLVNI